MRTRTKLVRATLALAVATSGLAFTGGGPDAFVDVTLLPPTNLAGADLDALTLEYEIQRIQDDRATTITRGELDGSWSQSVLSIPERDLVAGEEVDLVAILWARPEGTDARPFIASVTNEIFTYDGEPTELPMQFGEARFTRDATTDELPDPVAGAESASGPWILDMLVPEPKARAPSQSELPETQLLQAVGGRPPAQDVVAASLLRPDAYELYSNPVQDYVRMRDCDPYDPLYTAQRCKVDYVGPGGGASGTGDPPQSAGSYLIATRQIPGVAALRGYSTRIHGGDSTFSFETSYEQKWEIGVRFRAGPFQVGGGKFMSTGASQTDTWPTRYDCIERPDHPCNWAPTGYGTAGTLWDFSRDTWRWERWVLRQCDVNCWDEYYERTYVESIDGGTEWQIDANWKAKVFSGGYMANPEQVRKGTFGSWKPYFAGGTHGVRRQAGSETTWSPGARVSAGNPAWGVAEFAANFTEKKVTAVKNVHAFRNDKEYFAWSLMYDKGNKNREYWTCEWAKGFEGSVCWTAP